MPRPLPTDPSSRTSSARSLKKRRSVALQLAVRLGVAVLALPVAVVITLVSFPFWSWLEATTGIESMGREGPAEWCYLAVWGVLALAILGPAVWRAARGPRPPSRGGLADDA